MSEAQDKLLQGEMNMTLNMTMMTSARDAVGKCLATLGGEYDNMLVLTADVDTSSRIQAFKEKYPDRCYNVGIAEQNLMSVSAGLAHEGFRPLAFAFAPFASMRCYEQVRTDICYSKLPVVIIGNGAGYSNGASGCTHCALEDSALMVACNNMTVLEPGDPFQIAKLLEAAMELNAPVYIRLGREATSSLYPEDTKYEIGKALIPREGDDGAFICTGIMVHFAMEAAKRIHDELGKEIRVVDMFTIKPLDKQAVIDAAKTGGAGPQPARRSRPAGRLVHRRGRHRLQAGQPRLPGLLRPDREPRIPLRPQRHGRRRPVRGNEGHVLSTFLPFPVQTPGEISRRLSNK